jgi:peptidyl-prolyl cis-trans isomerase SurA
MAKHHTLHVVVVAAALVAASVATRAEIIEQILVKVNGEIFTKSDLEQRQVAALRQKGQQFDLKSNPSNEQLRQALDEITPQIMVEAVDEMVVVQRGKELGYKLSEEQFKQVVDNIRKENKIDNDEQFLAALKSENMTMADLRRNLERSMIFQRVQQNEVLGKIGVTDDEAKKYYQTHMNEFTTAPSVTLREIQVAVPGDGRGINVAADEAAQARIEELRVRVTTGGEAFDKLAAEVSDSPSKANGGLIGPIKRDELAEPLQKMLDAMKVGDLTDVLRTQRGYQILKLDSRTETKIRTFDEARSDISNRVGETKMTGERMKYLERLRAQATITWRNDELKKAYEIALAARQKALAG